MSSTVVSLTVVYVKWLETGPLNKPLMTHLFSFLTGFQFKAKGITPTNQNRSKQRSEPIRTDTNSVVSQ